MAYTGVPNAQNSTVKGTGVAKLLAKLNASKVPPKKKKKIIPGS